MVDGCPKKFMDPGKRRLHLIDKHKYPRDYAFSLTAMPRQGRRGQIYLPPTPGAPRPPAAPTDAPEMAVDAGKVEPVAVVEAAVPPVPAAPFVPRQIAFGRGGGRARMFGTGSTTPNRYVNTMTPGVYQRAFSPVPLLGCDH